MIAPVLINCAVVYCLQFVSLRCCCCCRKKTLSVQLSLERLTSLHITRTQTCSQPTSLATALFQSRILAGCVGQNVVSIRLCLAWLLGNANNSRRGIVNEEQSHQME